MNRWISTGAVSQKPLIRKNAIPHFERWIDWQNSARRGEYESLRHRENLVLSMLTGTKRPLAAKDHAPAEAEIH